MVETSLPAGLERRVFGSRELRMSGSGNRISGTAASYGVRAKLPGFHEQIEKRAFDRVLRTSPDVLCLFNHNADAVLGRTTAGTLQLRADDSGLHYECDLPNTSVARDLKESIRRGDVNGCSFAFTLGDGDQEWSDDYDENRKHILVRTIKNFSNLIDVSPVTSPAYGGTHVSVDDRSTIVAAEARSRAESMRRVHAGSKWQARLRSMGVTNEVSLGDVYDAMDRRKALLDFILD